MGRKEMTERLSRLLEKYIDPCNDQRVYWASEVTFDYSAESPIRVDYMQFKPVNNSVSGIEKGDFTCFEIKSSVEDFRSPNGHNFIGDRNYYVMPNDVYEAVKGQIHFSVGVLVPRERPIGKDSLVVKKRSKRMSRKRPVSEMLLMMYRSSRREVMKMRRIAAREELR